MHQAILMVICPCRTLSSCRWLGRAGPAEVWGKTSRFMLRSGAASPMPTDIFRRPRSLTLRLRLKHTEVYKDDLECSLHLLEYVWYSKTP
jgi:hypothetical protein